VSRAILDGIPSLFAVQSLVRPDSIYPLPSILAGHMTAAMILM